MHETFLWKKPKTTQKINDLLQISAEKPFLIYEDHSQWIQLSSVIAPSITI